jgi:dihydroorotate dehydrogenase
VLYRLVKPLFFAFSPEKAHHLTMSLLETAVAIPLTKKILKSMFGMPATARLERSLMGISFPNPVGLAAGFDKNGQHINALACLGFGFIEVGTVTPIGQEGNPQPRLFRLPQDRALINRMGFNNAGLEALVQRLQDFRQQKNPPAIIIGGNIGKNKNTPNEQAAQDYMRCFEALHPWVDYFVVNVSSPNTPNLRALQEREPLEHLLRTLQNANTATSHPKPILLKIAPDLNDAQLNDVVAIVHSTGIAGLIATNTTISRAGLQTSAAEIETIGAGGLSGAPVRVRSTEVIRYLRKALGPSPVIIGVGGIDSPAAALEKMEAGANAVQVYSGLVYEGPSLVKRILQSLST